MAFIRTLRGARGLRPSGPAVLNRTSPQATGLGLWAVPVLTGVGYRSVLTNTFGAVTGTTVRTMPWVEQGAAFNAGTANEYAALTYPNAPTVNTCSFTSWFYMRSAVTLAPIIQCDTSRSQSLGVNRGSTGNQLTYTWDNVPGEYDWDSGLTIPTGVWALAVLSFSPSAATIYLASSQTGLRSATQGGTANTKTLSAWYVGNDFDIQSRAFDGLVGEWRVYPNVALSQAQVWSLYEPSTRWDLYAVPSTRVYFDQGAAAAALAARRQYMVRQASNRAATF